MGVHQLFSEIRNRQPRKYVLREKRYPTWQPTVPLGDDGAVTEAVIVNLSNRGCCVLAQRSFRPGERLRFTVEPLGDVEGEVRWSIGARAGLQLVARNPFEPRRPLAIPA